MGLFDGLATSDEALDGAAGFQEGFREYLPLYNDYTGSALSLTADIQHPYDELREIDFRRLSEVAEEGAAVAGELQETREKLNSRVAGVTSWSGDAANAFLAHIQRYQTAAQTIDDELGDIATTTGDAAQATRTVVAEYVETIGEIDFSGFDPPELIRILITIERMAMSVSELIDRLYDGIGDLIGMALPVFSSGGGGLFGSVPGVSQVVDAASEVFGDLVGGVLDFFGGADELLALASRLSREYLDASFRTPFENNLQLLGDAVQTATEGVTEAFQPMMDAAAAVTPEGFTALGEAPEGNPAQAPTAVPTGGSTAVPAGGSTAVPSGSGAVPLGTLFSTGPGDGVTGSTATGTVATGTVEPSGSTVPAGGPPEPPPPPAGPDAPTAPSATGATQPGDVSILPAVDQPGDTPSQVTMRLGDLTIIISGTDGTDGTGEAVGLTLTDADGDSRRYEIRIDADGDPRLVPVEPDAAQPAQPSGRPGAPGLPTVAAASAHAAVADVPPGGQAGVPVGVQPGLPTAVEPAAVNYGYADRPDFTVAPLAAESAIGQPATTIAADSSASGTVVGGFAAVSGEVDAGGQGYAATWDGGHTESGTVSFGDSDSGSNAGSGAGSAQLASASDSGPPGGAQLASAAEEPRGGQGGAPFAPLGAAGSGGDERRGGGTWQVPDTGIFEPEDEGASVRGVLGDER